MKEALKFLKLKPVSKLPRHQTKRKKPKRNRLQLLRRTVRQIKLRKLARHCARRKFVAKVKIRP